MIVIFSAIDLIAATVSVTAVPLSSAFCAPSFAIDVTKRPGANILGTVKAIKQAVSEEEKGWPPNVKTAYSFDQSDQIARMLVLLESGLMTASILVMSRSGWSRRSAAVTSRPIVPGPITTAVSPALSQRSAPAQCRRADRQAGLEQAAP